MSHVRYEAEDEIVVVTIDRPEVRNAVDRPTADELASAFRRFERDGDVSVAVLTGGGGTFCAGADLKALAGDPERANRLSPSGDGPMGPTRMVLDKPVIAAIEGHAVAGGLELALWCDLRVAAADAILGVFSRRVGVPLIDGGTARLPRIVGLGRALDLILTGRPVTATEAHGMGLVTAVVDPGRARAEAMELAHRIAGFPHAALRADRTSAIAAGTLAEEFHRGIAAISSGEADSGARHFIEGEGRGGS
jgi:enoyl-CoA hydratase